ncbi:MAG: dac [Acidimicrobiales bacterium]|nr:dac [Acidimicrobiales bacterium]
MALVVALLVGPAAVCPVGRAAAAPVQAEPEPAVPATPVGRDALAADLDAVMAFSPADSCLSVTMDDEVAYRHGADRPLVPASTEKLLTAEVALDQLGVDHRYATRVLATGPVVDGVVQGDLVLVGSGDPTLFTDAYRLARRIGDERPRTSFDALAAQVQAAGIVRVAGRVVGDESRYDAVRTGPTWPARYADQGQSGPLSALTVDEGYTLGPPPAGSAAPASRRRSADPPADAARTLNDRLLFRGIQAGGPPGSGTSPPGATEVTRVTSAPLRSIVERMLLASDNQIAELLTKELGLTKGEGGTTVAGAAVIERRIGELGGLPPGSDVVDGSGLDGGNRVTCDQLVSALLRSGGIDGTLGRGLPVAGRSGTLAGRFRGTVAEGRLRAKTGSLNDVTALAGFVPVEGGGTITFAYLANGRPVDAGVLGVQDLLAAVLARYQTPCADAADGLLVAPLAPYAAQVGTLSMFPLQSVLLPGALLPLHVFEDRYRALVERCLAADEDFGVVLISRGSEVGGGDLRTDVGTRARIVRAEAAPDGRCGILAAGTRRIRVDGWLEDDPYPRAEIRDWPDPAPGGGVAAALGGAVVRLRRVLALRAELGEAGPPATVDLDPDDPSLASHRLVGLSPLGDLDRQELLSAPSIEDRLARLEALLVEEEQVSQLRLAGG